MIKVTKDRVEIFGTKAEVIKMFFSIIKSFADYEIFDDEDIVLIKGLFDEYLKIIKKN